MEILQKYWYIVLAALALLFIVSRRSGGGVTQISGGGAEALAMAQLSSAERDADETRKYGLISTVLNYQLADKNLNQQIDLAKLSNESQIRAMENQYLLASLSAQMQTQANSQQFGLQQYALQQQAANTRRNDWLGAISTGLQTVIPTIFGNSTSGGGGLRFPSTPPIFGSQISWRDWF